jgi:hypothetical protein
MRFLIQVVIMTSKTLEKIKITIILTSSKGCSILNGRGEYNLKWIKKNNMKFVMNKIPSSIRIQGRVKVKGKHYCHQPKIREIL